LKRKKKTMCDEEKKDVGHLLEEVMMTSNEENYDDNMMKFMDETAEILGDAIGAACNEPVAMLTRFTEVMIGAAKERFEKPNAEVR